MFSQEPEGYVSFSAVYERVLRIAPSLETWRQGNSWHAIFPEPSSSKHGFVPGDSVESYMAEVEWAVWQATKAVIAEADDVIGCAPFREPVKVDIRSICELTEFPETPWFDARTGYVKWNDEAFADLVPVDLGQRKVWRSWTSHLELGGELFVRADAIQPVLDAMLARAAPIPPIPLPANEARAKKYWGQLETEEFNAMTYTQLLNLDHVYNDNSVSDTTKKKALKIAYGWHSRKWGADG